MPDHAWKAKPHDDQGHRQGVPASFCARIARAFFVFVTVMLIVESPPVTAQRSDRVMPPQDSTCDRNQLTSYNGVLSRYETEDSVTVLEIETEWGTTEQLKLQSAQNGLAANFLLNGRPFEKKD